MTDTTEKTTRPDWRTETDAALAEMGITFEARFVPQSISRNRGERWPSLNWVCRITRNGFTYSTDYTQGIGHVPNYPQGARTVAAEEYRQECERAAETGQYPAQPFGPYVSLYHKRAVPAPALRDVVYSLLSDADLGAHSFADFCADLGFDEDSRSAETLWRACGETARAVARLFNDAERATLSDLFAEY